MGFLCSLDLAPLVSCLGVLLTEIVAYELLRCAESQT